MFYWIVIVFGIIMLSFSISNPFYRIVFKKFVKLNLFITILIRFLLFLLGTILVFLGLYIESMN